MKLCTHFCCSLFWFCNDIAADGFNLCPISPQPFVGTLSSCIGEEGRIMQWNNGAPLCQLAPIRRTYRLCQNRRRPNCSSAALTWEGELYTRGLNTTPLATQRRSAYQSQGLGVFVVCCLMATWSCCEESRCLVWGDAIQEWKGNKEETHSPSKP